MDVIAGPSVDLNYIELRNPSPTHDRTSRDLSCGITKRTQWWRGRSPTKSAGYYIELVERNQDELPDGRL